jgi:hypothetical protein
MANSLVPSKRNILLLTATHLKDIRPSKALLEVAVDATQEQLLILLQAGDIQELAKQSALEESWRTVHDTIAYIYVMSLAAEQRRPHSHLNVTVTLDGWCGYAPGQDPSWTRVLFRHHDDKGNDGQCIVCFC